MTKVFVLGIDGAFPEYVFGEWRKELPNINKLMNEGVYAKLNSTIPPLSGPAWVTITTGKGPADTGIFEYTYRKNYSYNDIHIVTSKNVKEKTIWQMLSDKGRKSIVTYLLLTWPVKPFDGCLITGPLTPAGKDVEFIYPKELKDELKNALGEVPPIDIENFRTITREEVEREMFKLTEKHFDVNEYLLKNKEWDLFFGIISGSDRMNHAFWRYMDPLHRKYEPNQFKDTLKNYYKLVDRRLGKLLSMLDKDTKIIVLSDHGIIRMHNRVNLTDWLIKEKYMALKEPIKEKKPFNFDMVDWSKTQAFAIGAYEGQIFLNLKGREPEGIVESKDYDKLVQELITKLNKIPGDDGKKLESYFFTKKDYFKGKCEAIAPDIVIYFDNLQYGCNSTLIGNETLWSPQTAKGSDDAGHSRQGIFIMKHDNLKNKNLGEIEAIDVAPTILNLLGMEIPNDMSGKVIGK